MRYLLFTICCLAAACGGPVADQALVAGAKAEDDVTKPGTTHTGRVTVESRDDRFSFIAGNLVRIRPSPYVVLNIKIAPERPLASDVGALLLDEPAATKMSFMVVSRHGDAKKQQLQLGMDQADTADYVGSTDGHLALSTGCTDKSAAFRYVIVDRTNQLTAFERAITCSENAVDDYVETIPAVFESPDDHEIYLFPIPIDGPNAKVETGKTYGYTLTVCSNGPC